MAGADVYTLKHPITLKFKGPQGDREETHSTVTLRRAKAKDLRALDQEPGDVGKALALISRLSDLPMHVIDELDAEDFTALGDKLTAFLPSGPPTGGTS